MKNFVLGVLFALIGLPAIDCLTSLLSNKTQLQSYKIAKQIYDIQKTMPQQEEPPQEQTKYPMGFSTSCVGFEVDGQEEYEE